MVEVGSLPGSEEKYYIKNNVAYIFFRHNSFLLTSCDTLTHAKLPGIYIICILMY